MNNGRKKISRFQVGMIISVVGFLTFGTVSFYFNPWIMMLGLGLEFISSFVCDTFWDAEEMLGHLSKLVLFIPAYGMDFLMATTVYTFFGGLMVAFSPIANIVIHILQGRWGESKKRKDESSDNNQERYYMAQNGGYPMQYGIPQNYENVMQYGIPQNYGYPIQNNAQQIVQQYDEQQMTNFWSC